MSDLESLAPLFEQIGKRSELTLGILQSNSKLIDNLTARVTELEAAMAGTVENMGEVLNLLRELVDRETDRD